MRTTKPKPTAPPPPTDYRAEAEARGKAAFEAATEPPTPESSKEIPKIETPPWWESPITTKGSK